MVASFNGWDDMREVEREALETWEREHGLFSSAWAHPTWLLSADSSENDPQRDGRAN